MEKYIGLQDITKKYLHADLKNVNIHYENNDKILIHIEYNDNIYLYDYELEVDKTTHKTSFVHHDCLGHGAETMLQRNLDFEHAIEEYLFTK